MRMADDAAERDRLATCLHALRRDPTTARYEVLSGGISGASTYRVDLRDEQIVLKIAEASSAQDVLERAQREIDFYRDLADRIPLRVPAVLGAATDSSHPWLCLRAYRPTLPIQTWSEQQYVEIAQQLGRFHATFWNRTEELSQLSWLRRHDRSLEKATLEQAAQSWRALATQPRYQSILTANVTSWIQTMVSRVARPDLARQDLPLTLCHGDCHHGNLLLDDDGAWCWADWQEVGIGRGPEDLSFFFQRARMAGGSVPEEVIVREYHRSLQDAVGQRISLTAVKRTMAFSELRTLLLFWPPFLSHASTGQMGDIVRRVHHLANDLQSEPGSLSGVPHSPAGVRGCPLH